MARPASPSFWRRFLPKLIVSLVLGAVFAWLVHRGGMPFLPSEDAMRRVDPGLVAAYVFVLLLTHFFRASRWRFLIAPVKSGIPFWDGVLLNWIGFFAIFALPLRAGELARPALTKIRHGVSISAGLGTVAVERVIDGLVTSLCVIFGLVALDRREAVDEFARGLPYYGAAAVTVFSAALGGLVLFLWKREWALALIRATFGRISSKGGEVLAAKVADVADGVRSIASPRLAGGFLLETGLYWGLNALGMWVLALACGLEMSFGHAVAVMGILAIGILLPAGPGLFGNFQLAVGTALKLYFATEIVGEAGAVYVFLLYVIQAVLITALGVGPLLMLRLSFADLVRTPPDAAQTA